MYRDSEGRTRRESDAQIIGQKIVKEIYISDPVNGVMFTLDESHLKAIRTQVNLQEFQLENKKLVQPVHPKDAVALMPQEKSIYPAKSPKTMLRKHTSATEALGKKTIEGIVCEGQQTTITIQAGAIGNTLPLKIISERWYSPELQVLVLTTQHDPRLGETTYRLTNINRYEPEKSLFEVPQNYTVIDKSDIWGKKSGNKQR